MMKKLLFILVLTGCTFVFGQVSILAHNTHYVTNFDACGGTLPTGYSHSGSAVSACNKGTSESLTTGGLYSCAGSGYGYQPSGTADNLTLVGTFQNTTGSTITELEISYIAFRIYHRTSRIPSWTVSSSLGSVSSLN